MPEMTMVRIYVLEGERKHHRSMADEIFDRLRKEHKIKGVTQFRGIAGFGSHGVVHHIDLAHLNAHLPIVIEFFDTTEIVADALVWIRELVDSDKIVTWKIEVG
jgi:PII-like signaling protein